MVFFVCEGCNETLKKNQVDKHAAKCRYCEAVTCVDCSVTFYGNDYSAHTTCVSEAQKYEKSLYKGPKQKINPQDEWNAIIEAAVSSSQAPPRLQHHLTRIGALDNIPRNRTKFSNFVKNSVRIHDDKIIGELFDYISSFKPQTPTATAGAGESCIASTKQSKSNGTETETGGSNHSETIKSVDLVEPSVQEVSSVDVEVQEGKKKKKRKHKAEKEIESEPSAAVEEVVEEVEATVKAHKKAKKRKHEDQ